MGTSLVSAGLGGLLLCTACGGGSSSEGPSTPPSEALVGATVSDAAPGHAPLTSFVPPSPAGCAAAAAYDLCFAFDHATPLAVRVSLPATTRSHTVAVVRFHEVKEERSTLVASHVAFVVGERSELGLYFQVYPGSYRIEVGVDLDGDGDPEGPNDAIGWSSTSPDAPVTDEASAALVDISSTPVATSFAIALRK